MNKNSWKMRVLMFWAVKVCRIPFTVNFTPPDHDEFYAVGFAWTPAAANRMRGDDMLIERLNQAQAVATTATTSRSARRMMNRAAKKAAEQERKR